jgi:hypothetical protein
MNNAGKGKPRAWLRLREMPLRYKAWHSVPLLMPIGLLLIFLGARGSDKWMIPVGLALLAVVVIDMAVVFPLVMVRAKARRSEEDSA